MKDAQPKSSTVAPVKHEEVHEAILEASQSNVAAEVKKQEGVEAPPPLPPREQADLTTEQQAEQAMTIQTVDVAKEKEAEKPKEEAKKEEKKVEAASTTTESAAVEREEERIRKELFPEDA
jgi:hypothetical protein